MNALETFFIRGTMFEILYLALKWIAVRRMINIMICISPGIFIINMAAGQYLNGDYKAAIGLGTVEKTGKAFKYNCTNIEVHILT